MVSSPARPTSPARLLAATAFVVACYLAGRTAYEHLAALLAAAGLGGGAASVLPLPVYLVPVVAGAWLAAGQIGLLPAVRSLLDVTPAARGHVLAGLVVAALLVAVTYAIDLLGGWAGTVGAAPSGHVVTQLAAYALLYAVIAGSEELVFRGMALDLLARVGGLPAGVLGSSALFAAVHVLDNATWQRLVGLLLLGLLLAQVRLLTGSLWPAIAAHLAVHFLSYAAVVGLLPVAVVLRGPLWLTGTPDQLDAGLVMIAVSAAAVAAAFAALRRGGYPSRSA